MKREFLSPAIGCPLLAAVPAGHLCPVGDRSLQFNLNGSLPGWRRGGGGVGEPLVERFEAAAGGVGLGEGGLVRRIGAEKYRPRNLGIQCELEEMPRSPNFALTPG